MNKCFKPNKLVAWQILRTSYFPLFLRGNGHTLDWCIARAFFNKEQQKKKESKNLPVDTMNLWDMLLLRRLLSCPRRTESTSLRKQRLTFHPAIHSNTGE
jgi:hypothetical protein